MTASGVFQALSSPVVERFSFRLNLSDPSANSNANFSQGACDDMAADTAAFFGAGALAIPSVWVLKEVKLARIGPLGKYLEAPKFTVLDKRGGGTAAVAQAPQVALAITLDSERRGPTGRGRFYLPAPQFGINPQFGGIDASNITIVSDAVKVYLNNINNAAGVDGFASKVTVASSKGYNSDVTKIRVGRAFDTIRSRRTDLTENYGVAVPL
jgi:hypothetical protein